jgi:transglutaminase-like putative cysteine protease
VEGPPLRPTPSWVDEATIDPGAKAAATADPGVEPLLSDRQVHVGPSAEEHYTRRVVRIGSPAGIEASSELTLDFDPTFEHLAFHHVRIIRGGRAVDALQHADWKVIQPESDLDKRIYSGQLEGLLFLHDVRVGDVLDYAFSITGERAVAPGRYAERLFLAEGAGVAWLRRRIVAEEPRQLFLKVHDMDPAIESSADGRHVYAWERRDVPATDGEDHLPSWYEPLPWVDVSDFANWNDVARSMAPLFPSDPVPSPEMSALVSRWKTQFASDDERARAATTFVQDEIRYLGIEMGPHSHEPFSPAIVLTRRFGDCKDKSFLLVTLLRELGIPADPVLVNTEERRLLDDRLPSPFAFDHAIVRTVVDGATRWLDATDSFQRGALADRAPPPFERALVVSPEAKGLEPIEAPRSAVPTYEVDDTFTVTHTADAPVALQVLTTHRGANADSMRAELAGTPAAQIARSYLNYYAEQFPKIVQTAEASFSDDAAANVVIVRESYSIPDFFTDGERDLSPEAVEKHLQRPRVVLRKMPLGVDYPMVVAQHTHIRLPSSAAFAPTTSDLADDAIRFHASQSVDGSTLTLDYRYETMADSVPPGKVADHLATIEKIRDASTFRLDATVARGSLEPAQSDAVSWRLSLGLLGLGAILGMVKLGLDRGRRRRGKASRARSMVASGEAPTHPIVVHAEAEIAARLADARCSCRGPLVAAEGSALDEDVRMGDKIIRVVRAACRTCGHACRLYFHVHPAEGEHAEGAAPET